MRAIISGIQRCISCPFFTFTQPEIAKSLLTYRLNKLPLAKERAKELSFEGALLPWRGISGHETSAYYPAGTAQFHINGDIAHAFALYEQVTGDLDFIAEARRSSMRLPASGSVLAFSPKEALRAPRGDRAR